MISYADHPIPYAAKVERAPLGPFAYELETKFVFGALANETSRLSRDNIAAPIYGSRQGSAALSLIETGEYDTQVGTAYIPRERVKNAWPLWVDAENVVSHMSQDLELFSAWLTNESYEAIILDANGAQVDARRGFTSLRAAQLHAVEMLKDAQDLHKLAVEAKKEVPDLGRSYHATFNSDGGLFTLNRGTYESFDSPVKG
jgi:hypothetical protein